MTLREKDVADHYERVRNVPFEGVDELLLVSKHHPTSTRHAHTGKCVKRGFETSVVFLQVGNIVLDTTIVFPP